MPMKTEREGGPLKDKSTTPLIGPGPLMAGYKVTKEVDAKRNSQSKGCEDDDE